MGDTFWTDYWAKRKAAMENREGRGLVTLKRNQGRIQVSAPYHEEFSQGARTIGGRWRQRSRVWTFPVASREPLKALLLHCYSYRGSV